MRTSRASLFGRVPSVACYGLFASVLLAGASTATAGWIWPPLGSNSYSYGFNPDPGGGPICPGTTVSISASISDQDTWNNGTPSGATLTVKVKCTLTGPGVNRVWSDVGTDSAPPLPLGASASISGSYELCTPGQYTLVFEFQEISPANDPGFPNPTTKTINFTVEGPEVTVDMEDVTCCPSCSYPLQIELTNSGDCPEDYEWELTGNGPALDPTTPFSPSQGAVTVPANSTVYLHPNVNTNPNAERGDTASITITLTTTDDCPADTKTATATVTIGRPDLVIDGVGEDDEEDPGVFVVLNDDDDDNNGVADLEQDEPGERPVPGENDLIPLTMSAGGLPDCGRLTLSVGENPPCGNITLWTTAQKDAHPASLDWDLSQGAPPTLYVEGIGTSCGPRDVTFTLTYYNDDCDPPQCSCSDVVKLTVVDVDISLNGVPETLEESEGAFVRYNEDDDDSSGVPDREESPLLGSDDDLVPVSMTYAPTSLHCGQLELTWSGSQVKVWDTTSKDAEITAPTWPADGSSIPTLYVEGYEASASLADVPFTFRWTCDQGNGFEAQDVAKATVIRANLVLECVEEKDETEPGAYLIENYDDDDTNSQADKLHNPVAGEDDLLALTAQIEPEIDRGTVTLVRGAGIVLWTTPEKESVVLLYGAQAWDLETEELPEEPYYVEGFDPGSTALLLDWRAPGKFDAIPDTIYVHVFNVDVDWPQVPDEDEEEPPGWIICVNDDDDDDSGTADSEESPVIGEDDLAAIGLSYSFGAGNPPEGTKWAIECSDNVAIWRDAEKQEAVECGTWQELETFPDPAELYVEGLEAGSFEVTLKIGAGDDPCAGAKDKVVGTVLKVDLQIEALAEADELDPGGIVCVNADYDEGNENPPGTPVADNVADHAAGHRIVAGDDELRPATIVLSGDAVLGRWTLTFPSAIKVWRADTLEEVISGAPSDEISLPLTLALLIEGITASSSANDVEISLSFSVTEGPTVCADLVRLTVVQCDLDVDSDNDGAISEADDAIEEVSPGKFVCLNNDFDEGKHSGPDWIPDNWDASPVSDDGSQIVYDELVPCERAILPADDDFLEDVTITLSQTAGDGEVRILAINPHAAPPYEEGTDWVEVAQGADLTTDYFTSSAPYRDFGWWLEGFSVGELDLELRIEKAGLTCVDRIRVTVFTADLDVDTNRNAVVEDDDDEWLEDEWSTDRGALFMTNYDDDDADGHSDSIEFLNTGAPTQEDLTINDAADVADVTPLVIRATGSTLDLQFFLRISADDLKAVHIFDQRDPAASLLWGGWFAHAADSGVLELEITNLVSAVSDVELGIEALFFRGQRHDLPTPPGGEYEFDGEVDIEFIAQNTIGAPGIDPSRVLCRRTPVRLKVAPYLMLPNTQDATDVYMLDWDEADGIVAAFGSLSRPVTTPDDQWLQDHVQIGYTAMPGTDMHVTVRMPRGRGLPQPDWPEDVLLFADGGLYRHRDTCQLDGAGAGDYGGNLELIPPSTDWPLGRIVYGTTMSARLREFFDNQILAGPEPVQQPFEVDTDWLAVGHVDEILCALPGGTRGYKVLVADTAYAEQLLRTGDAARGISAPSDDTAVFATGDQASGTSSTSVDTHEKVYLFDGVAHGHIQCVPAADLVDGETVTISDGTTSQIFEFDDDNNVVPGHVRVALTGISTAAQLRDRLRSAINGVSGFNVHGETDDPPSPPPSGAYASIVLINSEFGTSGNVAIAETVTDADFRVQGMSGGELAADGRDFTTTTWTCIRVYDGTGAGQVARIQTRGRGWISVKPPLVATQTVYDTTSHIVQPAGGAGLYGYIGYYAPWIPSGNHWLTEPASTSMYIVVTECKYWLGNGGREFPALHSVFELKHDSDLWNLNDAAGARIDGAKAAVQNAMGAGFLRHDSSTADDSLTGDADDDFVIVPNIYFGRWSGSLADRLNVAFIPGLANVQPANTNTLVFPKPFGPVSGPGDVLERAAQSIIGPGADFADDWDGYHRRDGEVHCATEVTREPFGFNWWEHQP